MKKKLFFRQWYLLLVAAVLLFSCRTDLQENLTRSDAQRNVSRISFSQFQKEIRRQDVNPYLVVSALKEAHTHSAHKDGETPSIAAFRMDTARVQRLEMKGETAYTMAAYNYMDPSEQLYNVIYFYRDGELHYTIHEIRENNTSVPVYDSRIPNQVIVGNPQASLCVEPYQSLDWACKNSEPENQCDKCINCFRVVTHYTYGDCGGGGGGYGSGNPDPDLPGNGPYTGGTGNGGSGGLNDPSHYFFDPLQDPTDPFQVRSMRAKLFWAHLEYEDKQWTNEHPAKYMAILEHYLDNYVYPDYQPNEDHHKWLIQILRNNPNYEWQYFYNQFLASPCEKTQTLIKNTDVKSKISQLYDKSKIGGEKAFKVNADGTISDLIEGGEHSVAIGDLAGYTGLYHNHTPLGIKIFSPPDIKNLFTGIVASPSGTPVSSVFSGVVAAEPCNSCTGGYKYFHYVVRFTGTSQEAGGIFQTNYDLDKLVKDYRDRQGELLDNSSYVDSNGVTLNAKGLEKLLFDTLANMNIDKSKIALQRVNTDGSVENINLDNNGTPVAVPCP